MYVRMRLIAILTGLLLASTLKMSANDNRFFVYNAANGLADNSAQTVTCTKTGRLVITTMGQINFFDGVRFTYIDPTGENLYPLREYKGNFHLYFDKYHHIWLKDRGDVTCVNLTTERFVDSVDEASPPPSATTPSSITRPKPSSSPPNSPRHALCAPCAPPRCALASSSIVLRLFFDSSSF